jgi:hypothetical protein
MSPDGGGRPEGELADAITEHFGSFEAFHGQLSAATTGVQGSGWGVLVYEPNAGKLLVEQVYDHHGNVAQGSLPLLAFDAWEHAYYLQYRNVRPDFVKAMWEVVNWQDVAAATPRRSATGPPPPECGPASERRTRPDAHRLPTFGSGNHDRVLLAGRAASPRRSDEQSRSGAGDGRTHLRPVRPGSG